MNYFVELLQNVRQLQPSDIPGMNPDRAALLNGTDKIKFDKEYDLRQDRWPKTRRSKPTEQSKTEEQVAEETARKLQELEAKRLRRMQGAPESSDEENRWDAKLDEEGEEGEEDEEDDFGLGAGDQNPTNDD